MAEGWCRSAQQCTGHGRSAGIAVKRITPEIYHESPKAPAEDQKEQEQPQRAVNGTSASFASITGIKCEDAEEDRREEPE